MKRLLIFMVRAYQALFSWWVSPCRFWPTCSCYMIEAIEKKGAFQGTALGVKRLLKCHPWHEGGVDLVPLETGIYE